MKVRHFLCPLVAGPENLVMLLIGGMLVQR